MNDNPVIIVAVLVPIQYVNIKSLLLLMFIFAFKFMFASNFVIELIIGLGGAG